jgi:hypothetical protein
MFYAPAITLSSLVVCYRRHFHIQLLLLCRLGKSSFVFCLCFNFHFPPSLSPPICCFFIYSQRSTQRNGPEKDGSVETQDDDWRAMEAKRKFLRRLAGCVSELCFRDHCVEDAYTRLIFLYFFRTSSAKDDEDEGAVFSAASSRFLFLFVGGGAGDEERV